MKDELIDPRINSYPAQVIAEQLRDALAKLDAIRDASSRPITVTVNMPQGFWSRLAERWFK